MSTVMTSSSRSRSRFGEAEAECRRLAREEGILVGQSSGATSLAARQVADRLADPSLDCPTVDADTDVLADGGGEDDCPLVVTVFWDSGERYMSTGMFDRVPA
jgi:cysteine synthase A